MYSTIDHRKKLPIWWLYGRVSFKIESSRVFVAAGNGCVEYDTTPGGSQTE